MRILYFTFMTPSVKFGGGLGVLKSLNALCQIGEVYYVGPEIDMNEISGYNINFSGHKFISMENGSAKRIYNLLRYGSPSLFVKDWMENVSDLNPANFDIVYLERTLQGFVCQWAKKAKLPLIVMTHNVEYDFIRKNGPSKLKVINTLFSKNAKKNESMCIQLADKVIVLTQGDCGRFDELYRNSEKYIIIPVCVNENIGNKKYDIGSPYILMTGSLWFGPNAEGIIWFLTNVWTEIENKTSFKIVIAGSNPNEELLSCVEKSKHITVVKNPEDMGKYYRGASIFVAPIFDGAGMKVKVAEAMSYGLPIIATEHAVIGYEKGKNSLFVVKSAEECKDAIMGLIERDTSSLKKIMNNVYEIYKAYYSLDAFKDMLKDVLNSVLIQNGINLGD